MMLVLGFFEQTSFRRTIKTIGATGLISVGLADVSVGDSRVDARAPFTCPVTQPNKRPLPGANEARVGDHGDGELWVYLPPDGRLDVVRDKGGFLSAKVPWVRAIRGRLSIQGRRLDAASSQPFTAIIPEGYKDIGFQPSILKFPEQGCWEVTGTAGTGKLTFVIEVRYEDVDKDQSGKKILRPRR